MNKINKKILILVISILLLIAFLRFSENSEDFSTYNADWNGAAQIKELSSVNHTVISLPAHQVLPLSKPDNSALVVLGPRSSFSENDVEGIKKFVRSGGLLIFADDFGSGNDLLNRFTPSVSFSHFLLQDDVSFWKNTTFAVVRTDIQNVGNITLNYPTSLVIKDSSINVSAYSSRFSWLSHNGSGTGSFILERESYPVIAEISFGQGKIVAISDPSIFINSMLALNDNKALLEELIGNRTFVYFDDNDRMPPASVFGYMMRTNSMAQYLFAIVIISMTFIYMKRDDIKKPKNKTMNDRLDMDEETIISNIISRQKWDERKFMFFKNKLRGKK